MGAFDWQSGTLGCEVQLAETVRDVQWLHNSSLFAVAQKRYERGRGVWVLVEESEGRWWSRGVLKDLY